MVTPFGLAGAPAAARRWIDSVLGDLLGEKCAAYLDDIAIFSSGDLEDYWDKVKQILHSLAKAGLWLDPKKCDFAKKETKYLGYVVEAEKGIKVDESKIKAIVDWERPKDIRGVREFLGLANFYRNFIEIFAEIAAPLQKLTNKRVPFDWELDQWVAFDNLKNVFITAPVLAMWHESKLTVLETDASGWATGGCLSQLDADACLHLVAYYSKKLSPAESNYDVHDKELLSIIRCLNEWRGELMGLDKPFIILTDHKILEYFISSRKLVEGQVRWAQVLSQFNFCLQFRPGKKVISQMHFRGIRKIFLIIQWIHALKNGSFNF